MTTIDPTAEVIASSVEAGNSALDRLLTAVADDSVVRAVFDFLKSRSIKSMYVGKDIPIGQYQLALKDSFEALDHR